jgi:hypothetical protein
MSKKKNRIKKEKAKQRKAWEKKRRDTYKKNKEAQQLEVTSRLKRPKGISTKIIDSLFSQSQDTHDTITKTYYYHLLNIITLNKNNKRRLKKYRALLTDLAGKCPKLLENRFWKPLWALTSVDWLHSQKEWVPKGRGAYTLFHSLINHLLVQYAIPGFLYSVFFIEDDHLAEQMILFFRYLALGGSVYKGIKTGLIPVKLTKRMCHYFLQSPPDTGIFEGFRNAQVKAFGGERRLAHTLSHTLPGRSFMDDEEFWFTVIMWFSRHSMLDPSQVGPLIDFILHLKRENPSFSITGRSVFAMLKEMDIWHGELARERKKKGFMYTPSGFKEGIWEIKEKLPDKRSQKCIWTMEEILSSKALAEEGKKMYHCVYTYHDRILKGMASIWTLKREGERRLTIEVSNDNKTIYQARGKYNRLPKSREIMIVKRWAAENMLKVKLLEW